MRVAVIGGGIVSVSLAYFLSQAGHSVVLYEASDQIGGLAETIRMGEAEVDRFYHTILSSDIYMQELAAELGIANRLGFRATRRFSMKAVCIRSWARMRKPAWWRNKLVLPPSPE